MRVRTLVAVGGLALAGTGMSLPAANAAEPEIISRTVAEAAPDCVGTLGATFIYTSCYGRAPGNQFRVAINCTNSGWRFGPWRQQTSDLSTRSRVDCLPGGTAQNYAVQFRTA